MFGTLVTVAAAFFDLGPINVPLMLLIATVKASLVALFFMHLWYDEKFNLVVLLVGVAFVGLFFIGTMTDAMTRGTIDLREKRYIQPEMPRAGMIADDAAAGAPGAVEGEEVAPASAH